LLAVGGGNSGLRPQTATTWTTGMDLHPASLQGTTFSVDYFHIDYTNLISTLGQSLLSVLAQEQIYAPLITRNPSAASVNQIYASPRFVGVPVPPSDVGAYVNGNPTNLGVLQERGLDIQAAQAFHTGFGTLNLQGSLTYLLDYKIAETPSAPLVEMVNTLNQPVRFRMRDSIGWSGYKSEAVVYVNYVGGYKNTTVTPTEDIHHWITTDLHLAYHPGGAHWLDGFTVSLDVQNLLNAAPPFVNNQVGYGYDPVNANALGRVVSLQVDKKW
jgi:iron complex outermembrane receptor protein